MSHENVELVKALQPTDVDLVELFTRDEALQARPFNAGPGVFDPSFEVSWISNEPGVQLEYRGAEGLVAGWREWLEPWASYRMRTEEVIDAGEHVLAYVHIDGRTMRDGVLVEHSPAAVWTIRDGKVVALRFYLDREQAMTAAGVRVH